jgi:hypothetical protein
MADGESAFELSTERQAAFLSPEVKFGPVRLMKKRQNKKRQKV